MTAIGAPSGAARPRLALRVAQGRAGQQGVIDAWARQASQPRAILVEAGLHALEAPPSTRIERLPGGCVCCVASVPLRVALVRVLRAQRPANLLLLLANDAHMPQVRRMLAEPPLGDAFTLETA